MLPAPAVADHGDLFANNPVWSCHFQRKLPFERSRKLCLDLYGGYFEQRQRFSIRGN